MQEERINILFLTEKYTLYRAKRLIYILCVIESCEITPSRYQTKLHSNKQTNNSVFFGSIFIKMVKRIKGNCIIKIKVEESAIFLKKISPQKVFLKKRRRTTAPITVWTLRLLLIDLHDKLLPSNQISQ